MAQTFEDSHFKWTDQYRGETTLRDCDELIGKIDDCVRDNPGYMEIEAALFKAFLYVAHWRKPKYRKSKEAKECLDNAFNKINKCQNDDARNGYSIVWHTLYWQIERHHVPHRAEGHGNHINKTPECNAFIDATRAFALSFLGIEREDESLKYYDQALSVYPNDINWLFGFAHRLGKKARRAQDKEALEKERDILKTILAKDPKHFRAMVNLAQNRFHKHDEKSKDIAPMFIEALELAKKDGLIHTKVAVRVAMFFRKSYNYKRALEILNCAERSIGKDPNEMLYHQKAKVYLTKYKKYDNLIGLPKDYLLMGENQGDKQTLLQECLIHLDEAIIRGDSMGAFELDRAYVYEHLGMHDKAREEYSNLIYASPDFTTKGRYLVNVKYGLYLEHVEREHVEIGNVEIIRDKMNYLQKAIELFKSQIYGKYSHSIDIGELCKGISVYDSTNASKCSSNTSNERAEALYRLGWLRLLFSDVTHEKLQKNILSKNIPTGKTHLQLYEQAYDEIENNSNDNSAPGFVSDIIEGLIICHLREGRTENLSKAEALIEQHGHRVDGDSEKLADLKLAQWKRSSESERPRLLYEAVKENNSVDACERICEWFESKTDPSSDPDVLRYCAQIKICLSRDKLMYQQYNFLGGLFLHTLFKTADLNNSQIHRKKAVLSRIEYIFKRKGDGLDKLRVEYIRFLESSEANSGEADLIEHCAEVICNARFALAHAVASFQKRWYEPKHDKKEMEFSFFKGVPNIKAKEVEKDGHIVIVTTLKEKVQEMLKKQLEGRAVGEKQWKMPEFSRRFPDLFEYYTSIQPALNPDGSYDWIAAIHDLTNIHKHVEPLSQMEYDVSVKKDYHYVDITRTFNIQELAQTARFGVEKIVLEFRNADDRLALRFAE